ncbi:hypothetical protein, partial [Mycobacterium sp. 050134]|uniref:hypothetical protein n=1 Tax=Mycobacterium sp. 050134 TaxID=3096111 RepID=UPI002ED7AC69
MAQLAGSLGHAAGLSGQASPRSNSITQAVGPAQQLAAVTEHRRKATPRTLDGVAEAAALAEHAEAGAAAGMVDAVRAPVEAHTPPPHLRPTTAVGR